MRHYSEPQPSDLRSHLGAAWADVLAIPREAGITGQFLVKPHAVQRQRERSVTHADLRSALKTACSAQYCGNRRWRLRGGYDLDGDPLTVVVEICRCLVVITVY